MFTVENNLSNDYKTLKYDGATYSKSKNVCTIKFLYNPLIFQPTDELKNKLKDELKNYVGDFVKIDIKLTKCVVNETVLKNYAYMTLVNSFPALSKGLSSNDIKVLCNGMNATISINLSPNLLEYAINSKKDLEIVNKLAENFIADFKVEFTKKEDIVSSASVIEDNIEFQNSIAVAEDKVLYTLTNKKEIIGFCDFNTAFDFNKIDREMTDVVVCGEIKNLKKRSYKRTSTRNGISVEVEKPFYTFSILNENKFLNVSFFPRSKEEVKAEVLEDGMKVALKGDFKFYRETLSFTATSIASCEYSKIKTDMKFKHVNERYHTVFPETYIDLAQSSIFDVAETKHMDKDYVVFDLETTGLDNKTCEIIEIGAVKVSKGKIVSTFSTFVKPSSPIPQEITDLTTISDFTVKDAPSINYVLPDFYKYTYNCVLVAHNIAFDSGFLIQAGKKQGYNFNNEQMDTMVMARQKLTGIRNFKLGTIAEKLGIDLVGAHRAVNDAMATAKVFIKLF